MGGKKKKKNSFARWLGLVLISLRYESWRNRCNSPLFFQWKYIYSWANVMRWEITDYVFTMRISFFKRKTQQKRCQIFLFSVRLGGNRKRRHVDHLLQHVCQIVVCAVLTSIIAVFFGRQLVLASLRWLVKGAQESGDATFRVQFPITPGMFDFLSSNSCVCGRSLKK